MVGMDISNHFSLKSSSEVDEICGVLRPLGITYFNYIKIYNQDGSRELLTNNANWIEHFYLRGFYDNAAAIDIEHLLPKGYFLWSELDEKDSIYAEGKEFFNIDNGISFVVKREDVTYLYIFASSRDNLKINNFYLKNIDLLQRFIHFFNDQGRTLKYMASRHRIYLPLNQRINYDKANNICLDDSVRNSFLEKTMVNKYFLVNLSEELYLTPKQVELAKLLVRGLSAKGIAKKLSLSHRTVESYLYEIKEKVSSEIGFKVSREKLIELLQASNLK